MVFRSTSGRPRSHGRWPSASSPFAIGGCDQIRIQGVSLRLAEEIVTLGLGIPVNLGTPHS
jgi:hypothetical protein